MVSRYDGRQVLIDLIPDNMLKSLSAGLTILTAMITPALLISAAGMFILSTSNRLGRVIDRVRRLTEIMDELMVEGKKVELLEERRDLIFTLIELQSRRARLLARALMVFYVATGMFVATSVAIGVITIVSPRQTWVPVVIGMTGAVLLLCGSAVLIFEAHLAIRTLGVETGFLDKLVGFHYRNRVTSG